MRLLGSGAGNRRLAGRMRPAGQYYAVPSQSSEPVTSYLKDDTPVLTSNTVIRETKTEKSSLPIGILTPLHTLAGSTSNIVNSLNLFSLYFKAPISGPCLPSDPPPFGPHATWPLTLKGLRPLTQYLKSRRICSFFVCDLGLWKCDHHLEVLSSKVDRICDGRKFSRFSQLSSGKEGNFFSFLFTTYQKCQTAQTRVCV